MKWHVREFLLFTIFFLIAAAVSTSAQMPQESTGAFQFGSSLKQNSNKRKPAVVHESPSTTPVVDELESEKIETRMVISDVLVLDKKGRTVSGLTRNDFEVVEDGVPQDIQSVTMGGDANGIGRSIILVIDYSQSVLPYVETSIDAAKTLVDSLNPQDRMAIVTDDVELLEGFTSDKERLKEKLESLKLRVRSGTTGKSRQYCALMATLRELVADSKLRPIVILQSDGDQYMLLKKMPAASTAHENAVQYSFEDVVQAAEQSGVTIYSIVPGPLLANLSKEKRKDVARSELDVDSRYRAVTKGIQFIPVSNKLAPGFLRMWAAARMRDQAAISTVAVKSGGWAENLEDPNDAGEIYTRILSGINSRYIVGYYPQNQEFDGSKRAVIVKVRGHPEYDVRGSKTYVANAKNALQ